MLAGCSLGSIADTYAKTCPPKDYMSLCKKNWTLCDSKLDELRDKRMTERKNNGLHHPKGQTDGKWNDDSPSSLLPSHSAIPFATPFFGYPSDCISSGQISAFTLHPLLPPPLLRRPTSVQWQGPFHLLGERKGARAAGNKRRI